MRVTRIAFGFVTLLLGSAVVAGAQSTTGTVSGRVVDVQDLSMPGVNVTASSPDLQGTRTTVTDSNGTYYIRGLAPSSYRISFEISGFKPAVHEDVQVSVGVLTTVNATMSLAAVMETVTVTVEAPSIVASPTGSHTVTKTQIDSLPVGRRPVDVAELAPSVTTNVFNTGQLTLSGSFGYDNVFMVNGVDVNDNIFGTSNNLFIEDAIEDVTVLSHGISAEWARFSGGVINVVTRSGGNAFSGSFREGLSNPKWIDETPLEQAGGIVHADVLSKTHEGTFGGPILRDRLWFFGAGRYETANIPNTFAQNGGGYVRTDTNKRGELKLTATVAPSQTVQASFIENATEQAGASALNATSLLDASTLTDRELPNRLLAVSYGGTVTPRLFATVQYSAKKQAFRKNGGTSTNIMDSPFRTAGALPGVPGNLIYNAPYLDVADPEDRNNRQVTGSLSYLLSTAGFGSHSLKGGAEHFVSTGIGGNSQSSTGYVFFTDYATASGVVVRDASGTPVPVFTPGVSEIWSFRAARGAKVNIKTSGLYLQDRWTVTPRLALDLGTRLELVRASASGDLQTVSTASLVPRLASSYDVSGDGKTILHATYGHYDGKYSQVQFAINTNVGRPDEVDFVYAGPAGQGATFAPGFDLANYTRVVFANFPTANVKMAEGIHSPVTREFTAGVGRELGRRGNARGTYVWRRASDFVEDFVTLAGGTTVVPLVGTLTNRVYDNTDQVRRDYQALILESGYRLRDRLAVDGSYTLQLRNHGTFAGESANQPGLSSVYGNFPEIFGPALNRLNPDGRLDNYQRHKLRVLATYSQSFGRFGAVDVAPLWRVNSGAVYSLTASIPVPAAQLARNPGYPATDISPATRETVFFGERGAYEYKGYGLMDLAATYNVAVWKTVRPWFKVEIYNLLNNQKQIGWDRTVAANNATDLDPNGIRTGFTQGPRFGQATSGTHFPQPYLGQPGGRTFRLALGVRF